MFCFYFFVWLLSSLVLSSLSRYSFKHCLHSLRRFQMAYSRSCEIAPLRPHRPLPLPKNSNNVNDTNARQPLPPQPFDAKRIPVPMPVRKWSKNYRWETNLRCQTTQKKNIWFSLLNRFHRIFLWTKNKMLPPTDWHREHRHIEIGEYETLHFFWGSRFDGDILFAGALSKARRVNLWQLALFRAHIRTRYLNHRRPLQSTIQIFHFAKQVRMVFIYVHAILLYLSWNEFFGWSE